MLREFAAWRALTMGNVYTTCLNRVAKDVRKLPTLVQPLQRPNSVSVRKKKMRGPNGNKALEILTRDLSILRSELYRSCSCERDMAATTTRKALPFDVYLSSLRIAEFWYRFWLRTDTTSWTKSATDGGATAPKSSTLPTTLSTNVVKVTGSL